ncbi:MAG: hypothetical protein KVP17_004334 [Porospora cf. gigantea B]|uniref:uncharacterized protein n=1 Tax=Porospora cf. gigantea B TaxID=2853592 RepID=UPI003571980A|nr:MAG: hypothetical protein KVP17_004334 [Porospora cf. gigantea B]
MRLFGSIFIAGAVAKCTAKPNSGPWAAHCTDADEATCKSFYAYCDWESLVNIPTLPTMGMSDVDLYGKAEKFAFWHYALDAVQGTYSCDCLDPNCKDSGCALNPKAEYTMFSVPDIGCHRVSDLDAVRHNPYDRPGSHMDLKVLFPDLARANSLEPGDGGASWFWWCATKKSWNEWDQTSSCDVGERVFDTEQACREYGQAFWRSKSFNVTFLSKCDRVSSKECSTSNADCTEMCKKGQSALFHEHCVVTDYQAENDHVWPNFFVPESNQCFEQWQIGYEDQGCDMNIPVGYDGGWNYGGGSSAQCGRFILNSNGTPKDVKSAHECQLECQKDEKCLYWQWRPMPDWNLATTVDDSGYSSGLGNRFNQVRLCALKNQEQVAGAFRAAYDLTSGAWLYNPKEDNYKYANSVQNNDCQPFGDNWCHQCKKDGKEVGVALKWRNVMLSGPRFCDAPKFGQGKGDVLPCGF